MRTRLMIFFLLAIQLFLSCSKGVERHNDDAILQIDTFPDGRVKSEQYIRNDSIADGSYKQYHHSGQLELEAYFEENKQVGSEKKYYESGKPRYTINYSSGVEQGTASWYYESGILKSTVFYLDGKTVGESLEFSESGKLSRYLCMDYDENVLFEIVYSDSGDIVSNQGVVVIKATANNTTFSIGDTLKISVLIATPPHCTYDVTLTPPFDEAGSGEIDTVASVYRYSTILLDSGRFTLTGRYSLKYPDGKESSRVFGCRYDVK